MITTTDTNDSRAALVASARDTQAETIRERHGQLMAKMDMTKDCVQSTITDAFDIAKLVEAARATIGSQFAKWWRDQDLPAGWVARYIKLAKTAGRNTLGDKDQLRLIGILPEADTHNDNQRAHGADPFAWTKQAGKLKAAFTVQSVGGLSKVERITAMQHLKPIVEVYEALKALSK